MSTPDQSKLEELLAFDAAVEAAVQESVRAAVLEHKQRGNPIAEWRDGKVVWVQPEDIHVDEPKK